MKKLLILLCLLTSAFSFAVDSADYCNNTPVEVSPNNWVIEYDCDEQAYFEALQAQCKADWLCSRPARKKSYTFTLGMVLTVWQINNTTQAISCLHTPTCSTGFYSELRELTNKDFSSFPLVEKQRLFQ